MTGVEGELVGGNRITGVAGRGAMGVVYRGEQPALGRPVAIKVVNPDLADDPEFRARFEHEARVAGSLDHPHIVPVYAAGEDRGRLYLTMRYVDGTDLATALRRDGPMPPALAVEVVEQVGSALDAAHERGLVHRDVKPANVMLTWRQGRPHAYLTDFGISKVVGAAGPTRTGAAMGTLDYMAPELLVGDPYDGRADVYALGAVLYQALTGRAPFRRETDAARIYAHLNDPVPEDERVPPALMSVVRRAMAKRPTQRYTTGAELAAAARAALGGQAERRTSSAAAALPYERVAGGASGTGGPGRRGLLLGGAAGLLAAAGVGGVLWMRERGDGPTVGGGGSATPTSEPTLPDDEPAGRVDARVAELKVGPEPSALIPLTTQFFCANNDNTVSHLSLSTQRVTSIDVGKKPLELMKGRSTVLCLNDDFFMVPIDIGTLETGEHVKFTPGRITAVAAEDDAGWVSTPEGLHRLDLNTGRKTLNVSLDRRFSSLSIVQGALFGIDHDRKELCRFDVTTGQQAAAPLPLPSDAVVIASVQDQLVVAGSSRLWKLVGTRLVEAPLFRTVRVSALFQSDASVWAGLTQSRALRRLRPDLSGFIGAPVPGVTLGPKFLAAVGTDNVVVVDDTTSKATVVTVTPLR
ncbi:serine/threonine protein kinase [Barrientosiimonas humi]|uniref:non-specific serine/threonine protein kinase n=1 Tax=Barrientosiimonas humi TaxID=999931 RepID=A0A542X8P1_9MICO|nr:serine/threonine protein kinase [Barrientosiimonas humi]CAG7572114.1 Serine/threonine-protein kinase PknH [Barrientosiimonas humi]